MKKLIPCLGLAIALAISANSYGVLVDSFEDGTLDPWVAASPEATLSIDPNDASHGSKSVLAMHSPGGFNESMKMIGAPLADLSSNTILLWDVKVSLSDLTADWLQVVPVINSELGGFDQGPDEVMTVDGEWHTYSWDYSAFKAGFAGSAWIEIMLVGNSQNPQGPGNPNPFQYHVDNIRLGPETGLPGDFDGNGVVDGDDFLFWQLDPSVGPLTDWENNYGNVATFSAVSSAVPEPSTWIAALLALMAMLCRRDVVVS